jgi:hypothetical protein
LLSNFGLTCDLSAKGTVGVGARCAVGGTGGGVGGPEGSGSGTGGGISNGANYRREWCEEQAGDDACPRCNEGLLCNSGDLNAAGECVDDLNRPAVCFGTCEPAPVAACGCSDGEVNVCCLVLGRYTPCRSPRESIDSRSGR